MRHRRLYRSLLTLLIALAHAHLHAQCPSNKHQLDLAGSFGLGSATEVTSANQYKEQISSSGNIFATVRYFVFNRLAIGLCGGMLRTKNSFTSPYDPTFHSIKEEQINTLALELYYIYLFRKYLEVYTFAGVGPGFYTTTTTANASASQPASPATEKKDVARLQYTPLGVRVGGRIGFFAELGFGYKGLANVGLSVKLGPASWWRG